MEFCYRREPKFLFICSAEHPYRINSGHSTYPADGTLIPTPILEYTISLALRKDKAIR